MITRWLVHRFDDRFGQAGPTRSKFLNRVLPDHWSFMLGEITLYSFFYLVVSGIFLTLFFENSHADTIYGGSYGAFHGDKVSTSYNSVLSLSWDVRFGLVVRQSHHWAALIFAGSMIVHLLRVYFTGGFRKPRELNWMIGVLLTGVMIANGVTGYDLPDDLLSGMGLNIVNSTLLAIPVIGTWLSFMLFGGPFPGDDIYRRLYAIHAIILPGILVALIGLHLLLVIRQRHTQFPGPGRTETNVVGVRLWPARVVRSAGLLFAVFAVCVFLGGLVQIDPIWMWGDFVPGATMGPAQPDWYDGWIDGALRLMPGWEPAIFGWRMPNLFIPAIIMPLLTYALVGFWPFIERRFTKDRRAHQVLERPRERPVRVGIGVMALTFYGFLLSAWGLDVISRYSSVSQFALVDAWRYSTLTVPLGTGLIAFLLAKALRDSSGESLRELTWQQLKQGLSRRKAPPPRRKVVPPRKEDLIIGHTPVEAGPVPIEEDVGSDDIGPESTEPIAVHSEPPAGSHGP